jgi:hypothetical protein
MPLLLQSFLMKWQGKTVKLTWQRVPENMPAILPEKMEWKSLNRFVYNAFARHGWMVPNQYWTPGVLSPMGIMGKYYNNYGKEFISPRELGRIKMRTG